MSLQPNPKPLENHLLRIMKSFNTAFREHFKNVAWRMVVLLKLKDEIFTKMFQVLELAGSYADGIKVQAPNEFDVLVLLKFPKPVPVRSGVPGYVTINIKDGISTWLRWIEVNQERYKRFIDGEAYLMQDEILDWLRKLVREILTERENILKIDGNEYHIEQANNGPAVTLEVNVRKSPGGRLGYFSIDFVPALEFQVNNVWVADELVNIRVPRFWNAIPKPNKMHLHKNREWICSYAQIERDYLKGFNRIKPLIKLFKKIRDKADLTNLKSYYIKTIFLHRHRHESLAFKIFYWNGSLAVRFMEMFEVILEHLRTRELWSLWHHGYNLFSQLDVSQIDAIYYNLKKIKETIHKNLEKNNPEIIYKLILTKEEKIAMERQEIVEIIEESLRRIDEAEQAERREIQRREAQYQAQLQEQMRREEQRQEEIRKANEWSCTIL